MMVSHCTCSTHVDGYKNMKPHVHVFYFSPIPKVIMYVISSLGIKNCIQSLVDIQYGDWVAKMVIWVGPVIAQVQSTCT